MTFKQDFRALRIQFAKKPVKLIFIPDKKYAVGGYYIEKVVE